VRTAFSENTSRLPVKMRHFLAENPLRGELREGIFETEIISNIVQISFGLWSQF
jgi:hypothetical protein